MCTLHDLFSCMMPVLSAFVCFFIPVAVEHMNGYLNFAHPRQEFLPHWMVFVSTDFQMVGGWRIRWLWPLL